ncbi:MAG: 50S ribosomal protein L4 [Candidatus Thermoplasmatota archaeon]|nr:50S ribosomal protein L4 [Candidatus Thermoplasmatota archaeon]
MNVNIYSMDGKDKGDIELPSVFSEEVRPDIIKRVVEAIEANKKQPYGASPEAGMRHATEMDGVGQGMARVQRLTQYGGSEAAESPQTRGGRKAHPPKAQKDQGKKINRSERAKARRSALAATAEGELVKERGHEIEEDSLHFPIIVEKGVEEIEKTKEAVELLENLGIYSDVKRAKEGKKIRAGKGKNRNRKYRRPKSLLVVLPDGSKGFRAFQNLPGVTVKSPENITVADLSPGGDIGRLALFSVKAVNELEDW